ncbi:MAG TPA: phosphatase PAP2 family protein [Candidatus Limnocylindrales bacterium]|nr:phosphatase PAP2 family protein [Candidatus Limnocylindrales bacterium]
MDPAPIAPSAGPGLPPSTDPHARDGEAVSRLMVMTLGVYLAAIIVVMMINRVWITPDVLLVFIGLGALLVGRGHLFIRDWLPFVAVLLAWEAMRGLADNVGAAVHSDSVIALERLISFGIVPTVELQRLLHDPNAVRPLDIAMSVVYGAHFAFPLVVAFLFWLRDRRLYYRFIGSLMLMAIAGFVIYILLPVAPPRFAYQFGEALPVHDIMATTWEKLDAVAWVSWAYANMSGNPYAAFPSLHAAFPVLAWLFVRNRYPKATWAVAVYAAIVWFAIVYLGHHYIVDILGGVALAAGTYYVVIHLGLLDRLLNRLAPRRPAPASSAAG